MRIQSDQHKMEQLAEDIALTCHLAEDQKKTKSTELL